MFTRHTSLPADEQAALESALERFDGDVDVVLTEAISKLADPRLEEVVRSLLFQPNEALPKRKRRPDIYLPFLVRQLYHACDPNGTDERELLGVCLTYLEYTDALDDLVDADADPEHSPLVYFTVHTAHLLTYALLADFGNAAVEYFTDHAVETAASVAMELKHEPSLERYLAVLDRQSHLFAGLTGLPALIAGGSRHTVTEFEELGTCYYKYNQAILDVEQYETKQTARDLDWNLWTLADDRAVLDRIETWRDGVTAVTDGFPERRRKLVDGLVSVDVETYRNHL